MFSYMKSLSDIDALIDELRHEYLEARKQASLPEQAGNLRPVDQVGELIRDERKNQGQTLQELSELSGVAYATLSKIENGDTAVHLSSLSKVLTTLGLKLWIG